MVSDPGSAATFAGAIAAATLAFVAVVFATTLVAIQLAASQASVPSAAQFAPIVSVTTLLALTVATVFGFVAYLHGVVRLMRVQYLLETIATESRRAIEENFLPLADPSPRRLCYTGPAGSSRLPTCTAWPNCASRTSAGSS
jgi:uncharacterized membrane protein